MLQFTLLVFPAGPANLPILVLIHEPLFLLLQKILQALQRWCLVPK